MTEIGTARVSLLAGLAAVTISSCCVRPLALSVAGVSGVWLGERPGLTFYRNPFLALAPLTLGAAWVVAFCRRAGSLANHLCIRLQRRWVTFDGLDPFPFLIGAAAGGASIEPASMATLLRSEVVA